MHAHVYGILKLKNYHGSCEIGNVRAMLLMSVAYIFTTTLLLVDLQLHTINQHQVRNMKCEMFFYISNTVQMAK